MAVVFTLRGEREEIVRFISVRRAVPGACRQLANLDISGQDIGRPGYTEAV